MEYVFFNYLTPPPSPPPQTIFKVVYGNHLVYLSVCLSVRLSAKFVSGQYISFGETLVPTWQKDCLWPEGVTWIKVIWASSVIVDKGQFLQHILPKNWYKTEILWVIRYPCMTSAESLDAVWTRNTIQFHTSYLTFDNMICYSECWTNAWIHEHSFMYNGTFILRFHNSIKIQEIYLIRLFWMHPFYFISMTSTATENVTELKFLWITYITIMF